MEKRCKTCSDSNTERKLLVIGVEYWDSNVLKDKSMHLYEHLRFFFFYKSSGSASASKTNLHVLIKRINQIKANFDIKRIRKKSARFEIHQASSAPFISHTSDSITAGR